MKINELLSPLNENPRDQYALENIAGLIADYIKDNSQHGQKSPFVFQLSDIKGLSHLYPRLRAINVVAFLDSSHSTNAGSFSSRFREIVLYDVLNTSPEKLESIIIHELRHALDSSYSNKKYVDRSRPYLHSQHEINARFSEALKNINRELRMKGGMDIEEYLEAFERAAVKLDLINVFADPKKGGDAALWLSQMGPKGMTNVFGRDTPTRNLISAYTNSSRYSSAITDKKRWNRLLSRVYKSWEYEMKRLK